MQASVRTIRLLLWLYVGLLLGEGALRKWVFPSLSGPLLVVRDPVLIAMYAIALTQRIFPLNWFVRATILLAGLSFFCSLCAFGHLSITLYGARTDFLHLPLIFLIPKVFNREDVIRMGRWFLLLSIPMTLLVAWQFRSPPDDWINATAGGDLGAQMLATGSHIRPPGTFSFVTGMVCFLSLVAAFLLSGFLDKGSVPVWLRAIAVPCLILSLVISGSRAAVASVTVIIVVVIIVCSRKLSEFRRLLVPAVLVYLAFLALSHSSLFQEGLEAQQERFLQGGGVQEGIVARYLGAFGQSIEVAGQVPLWGYGLGLGTNAGAALLTGSRGFLLAESEWPRVIAESGPILGYAYLLLRLWICGFLIQQACLALGRGHALPIFLMAAAGLDLISGQFGQPTTLGFAVLSAGLSLASSAPAPSAPVSLGEPRKQERCIRGRSAVAEAILAQDDI
jgi:O-Antigen ligase